MRRRRAVKEDAFAPSDDESQTRLLKNIGSAASPARPPDNAGQAFCLDLIWVMMSAKPNRAVQERHGAGSSMTARRRCGHARRPAEASGYLELQQQYRDCRKAAAGDIASSRQFAPAAVMKFSHCHRR
jgi:hypothetical protein